MLKKIAYITSQYPEFHETFVAREVEALRKTGTDVLIYSLKKPPPNGADLYPGHRSIVRNLPFFFSRRVLSSNLLEFAQRPQKFISSLVWLVKHYYKRPIDLLKSLVVFPETIAFAREIRRDNRVVHAHWATIPTAMGIVIKKMTGTSLSITAHAWDIFLSPPELLKEKIALSNGVVTCTGYNVKYLKNICIPEDKDKIWLNYHGLDFSVFENLPSNSLNDGTLKIVAVGRLVEQKGFIYLIRSLFELGKKDIPVSLTIIGDGPLEHELKNEAKGLPKGVSIHFVGRVAHMETLRTMANSDVMVAPSVVAADGDRDGIPNVVIEAMACGLPIVASNVSGIPEIVINNETGFLIEPSNPEALAEAFMKIFSDRENATKMGAVGREMMRERFDVNKNIQEFLGLLEIFHQSKSSIV